MKKRGEITIFLVLILSVISVFIIRLSGLERRYISGSEAVYAVDDALRSCFAEYNRELFDRYHILVIDSSYKFADSGADRVKEHFMMYLSGSITQNGICSVDIPDIKNAGEENYRYLYESAVGYAAKEMIPDPRLSVHGDDALFLTYLLNVFGNCRNPSDGCIRDGETEFLLYGNGSDSDNIFRATEEYEERGEGDYDDHLCHRLEEEDMEDLRRRFADLLTEYMRSSDSPGFDLQTCYCAITVETVMKGIGSGEYGITRRYAYEGKDM